MIGFRFLTYLIVIKWSKCFQNLLPRNLIWNQHLSRFHGIARNLGSGSMTQFVEQASTCILCLPPWPTITRQLGLHAPTQEEAKSIIDILKLGFY